LSGLLVERGEPPKSTRRVDRQVDLTLAENQQKVKQTQEFGSSQAPRFNRGVPMTRKRGTPHFEQLRREAVQKLWNNK
jgi:hypothetical protein